MTTNGNKRPNGQDIKSDADCPNGKDISSFTSSHESSKAEVTEGMRSWTWDLFAEGKSQQQIAAALGLSQGTVSRYLVGEKGPALPWCIPLPNIKSPRDEADSPACVEAWLAEVPNEYHNHGPHILPAPTLSLAEIRRSMGYRQ